MTGGRNDTKLVKTTVGKNIQRARDKKGLSRKELADQLSELGDRPIINKRQEDMSEDRLKKWEYGENAINIEWIPLICRILDCDVGYLFGEYEEYTIDKQKIKEKTKLSTKTVDWLLRNKTENPQFINALNELFEYDDLADTFFSAIFDFALSHFSNIVVSDALHDTNKRMGPGESKRILKFSVQECFSDILDRIWNENQPVSMAIANMRINGYKRKIAENEKSLGKD